MPALKCFDSQSLVHKVGFLSPVTRCNRQNFAMCVVCLCSRTLQLILWSIFRWFSQIIVFSRVKMAIRGWPSRIYLHLEGFKLPLWDTPVAHQIVAGNSISVTWGSNGSVPTMACFRYCFCWPSLVRFVEFIVFPLGKLMLLVGVCLTFAPKTRAICCQNLQPVCAWNDFVANMSALAAHGTLLHMLCFLE